MSSTQKKNNKEMIGPENKPAVLLHQETGYRTMTYVLFTISILIIGYVIYRLFVVKKPIRIGGGGETTPGITDLSAISEASSEVLTNLSQL